MIRNLLLLLVQINFLLFAPVASASGAPQDNQVKSAGDVIASINAYRAQYGLAAYQTNSKLMAAAQAQSDYQASIGSVTHSGPGGTRPSDRAYAVGYGDGNTVWVSEIIYGGYQATVADAVGWWKTSAIHNDTMLASQYQEIGAGVASSGSTVYYTALVGYVTGSAAPETSSSGETAAEEPPAPLVIPVTRAEPQEDGSIVHTVRTGQSLWNISAVYEVPLETILALNDLTENSLVQVGQEILVVPPQVEQEPPSSPTVTHTETTAVEETPEVTAAPTQTVSPTPEPAAVDSPEPVDAAPQLEEVGSPGALDANMGTILAGGIILFFLVLLGLSFKRLDHPQA